MGHPTGMPNMQICKYASVGKICVFRPKSHYISETMQDKKTVTVAVVNYVSNQR